MRWRRPAGAALLAAALAVAACSEGDGDPATDRPWVEDDCVPVSCEEAGADCGELPDGCGGVLECGACPPGETCGGGGGPSTCGSDPCEPVTCAALPGACGLVGDGCAAVLDCGRCGG